MNFHSQLLAMTKLGAILLAILGVCSALPNRYDPVIAKYSDERWTYLRGPDGTPHLVDMWMKVSDLEEAARFNPDTQNQYHLFTRSNPTVSQPIIFGSTNIISFSNFDANKRTIVLLHGWLDSVLADFNSVLIPAFLEAEDVNVIAVDWDTGAGTVNYLAAVTNTVTSGESVGRFINWLMQSTGQTPDQFHVVGHSLGGHQSGIIGRHVNGNIGYITAIDPASPGWNTNDHKFQSTDGAYTEIIHTNSGLLGYLPTLGHVDFYPNGGINMPGCSSQDCDHQRGYHYLAESLRTGGFTGRQCATFATAMLGQCYLWARLPMGGLLPKTGQSGIYYLETNAAPPFSRG